MLNNLSLFDSHFHIIDPRYPLVSNNGYLPAAYKVDDYLERMKTYNLIGGAIVSGSFQGFDQQYLLAALKALGKGFVGVTQVPVTITDEELAELNRAGVCAVRFNLKRGGSENIRHLKSLAQRVYSLFGWHIELYIDSSNLSDLKTTISTLPAVSVDHLGLSKSGLSDVRFLLEKNIKLKACGFGRVNFDVKQVLPELYAINPESLMFGSDLPSTRAPTPFKDSDFNLVRDSLNDDQACSAIFSQNALNFYRIKC